MKKLLIALVALASLAANGLFAQSMVGTWQGTLNAGKPLRIVVKVTTTDKDALKAVMYSIDQGSPAIPASTFTVQGSNVKFEIPAAAGLYEGKLAAGGNSIAGNWSQGGGKSLPLNLERATPETTWVIPEPTAPVAPMKADATPAFEVATIKPAPPDRPGKGFTMRGKEVLTIGTTVDDLITFAYDLHTRQVTGGPSWLESDKFDITGQPDSPGRPNLKQFKIMVQKLLADRFQLTFHRDKKEMSAYAIVVAKAGPKLTKSEDPGNTPGLMFPKLGLLPARNATMEEFAQVMQGAVLDRPVVDQTGIAGRWDFTLTWTPDPTQFVAMGAHVPPPTDDPSAPPDLFTAFVQQLGLRLEATKAPVGVIVVDKVEKPSGN
jgi:uncharacterized protein (TIGR03435 family)